MPMRIFVKNYPRACVNVVVRTPFTIGFPGAPSLEIPGQSVLEPWRG
jgi:hypothetical protein